MYTHSEKLDQFMPAFLKAQIEMDKVVKNSSNPQFKRSGGGFVKYADINAVLDVALPALNANGIALEQPPIEYADGCLEVAMILTHASSCQYKMYTCKSPVAKIDPQGIGGAETYLRRYLLVGALALGAEDDDGNSSSYTPAPKNDDPAKPTNFTDSKRKTNGQGGKLVKVFKNGDEIFCVNIYGKPIALSSMNDAALRRILELEEYKDAWPAAREFLAAMANIEAKLDESTKADSGAETTETNE